MDESGEGTRDREERPMSPEATDKSKTCPGCGAEVEPGAKFCTNCAAPLDRKGRRAAYKAEKKKTRGEPKKVEPWAVKAGDTVARVPRWVKIWVPLGVLLIVALLVILFVIAAGHTPQAAIERYFGRLQHGQYDYAYEMLSRQSGKFGTAEYFVRWQELQSEQLGRLEDFSVRKRDLENRLFGRYTQPDPEEGSAYVATLQYKEKTYDVNVFAVEDGGAWPATSWKVKLSEGPTRAIVAPLGARIYVDGLFAGVAEEDKDLKEALTLKDFPDDFDEAVDYVRKLLRTFENSVLDLKTFLRDLDMVAEDVKNTFERLQTGSVSWQQIVDSWDQVVSQSKSFAGDIARAAVHLYWIFGGGDDGSVRARYTRVESGLDLRNLPEGWHEIEAKMAGMDSETKEFFAPETVSVSLDTGPAMENDLKTSLQNYFAVRSDAFFNLNPVGLAAVAGGKQLEQDLAQVADLATRGLHQASDLRSLKYIHFKVLAPRVATIETEETWNYTIYQGQTPVNIVTNQKNKVTYTLQRDKTDSPWKVTESK
jgi:zinc-ribbon domain